MGTISLSLPILGQPDTTEDVKLINALTAIQTVINGNLDATNLSATAAVARSQLAGGFGDLIWTSTGVNTSGTDGHFYGMTAAATLTLPAPALNATVGVFNQSTGAVVTIAASSGIIGGVGFGISGVSSFTLGTSAAAVVLLADGSNWHVVGGYQDTGWVTPSFATNVAAAAGFFPPSSRLRGDVVRLKGQMVNNTGASILSGATWATLPANMAPSLALDGLLASDSGGVQGRISITTGGVLSYSGNVASTARLRLDGITYTLG